MWDTTCRICQRPFWKHVWRPSNQCPHHGFQQGLWQGWSSKITLKLSRIWYYRPDSSMDPAVVKLQNPGRCCGWGGGGGGGGAVWPSPSVLGSPPRLCAGPMPVPLLHQRPGGTTGFESTAIRRRYNRLPYSGQSEWCYGSPAWPGPSCSVGEDLANGIPSW